VFTNHTPAAQSRVAKKKDMFIEDERLKEGMHVV
jgi:hypothetical protein